MILAAALLANRSPDCAATLRQSLPLSLRAGRNFSNCSSSQVPRLPLDCRRCGWGRREAGSRVIRVFSGTMERHRGNHPALLADSCLRDGFPEAGKDAKNPLGRDDRPLYGAALASSRRGDHSVPLIGVHRHRTHGGFRACAWPVAALLAWFPYTALRSAKPGNSYRFPCRTSPLGSPDRSLQRMAGHGGSPPLRIPSAEPARWFRCVPNVPWRPLTAGLLQTGWAALAVFMFGA